MKKILLSLATASLFVLPMIAEESESESVFSYSEKDAPLEDYYHQWITGIADYYDACIFIKNQELVDKGTKIVGLKVPVVDTDKIRDYKLWISNKIIPSGGFKSGDRFIADLESIDAEPVDGWIEVRFSQPYKLTSDGIFVGYSFESTEGNQPIFRCTAGDVENSFYVRNSTQAYNWKDYSEASTHHALALTAIITGEYIQEDVDLQFVKDVFCLPERPEATPVTIVNRGAASIATVGYTFTIDGESTDGTYTFDTPVNNIPGTVAEFPLTFPVGKDLCSKEVKLSIHTINGNANKSQNTEYTSHVSVVASKPERFPFVEDYTGMWCTYCVNATAAMNMMNANEPDFVGVAMHFDDMLQVTSGFPSATYRPKGYPRMRLDRVSEYAVSKTYMPILIEEPYYERKKEFTPASVDVTAEWNDEGTEVNVTSTAKFVLVPYDGASYRMNYYLVGDGLKAEDEFDERWWQFNGVAGRSVEEVHESLADFALGANPMPGVIYNDVALYIADYNGVQNSLPVATEIELDKEYVVNHTIKIDDCTGVNSEGKTMVQDKNMLSVVATLLKVNEKDGSSEICNSKKFLLPGPGSESGVGNIAATKTVSEVYYDLSGSRVSNPEHGVYIRVKTLADGARKADKIYVK